MGIVEKTIRVLNRPDLVMSTHPTVECGYFSLIELADRIQSLQALIIALEENVEFLQNLNPECGSYAMEAIDSGKAAICLAKIIASGLEDSYEGVLNLLVRHGGQS